MRSLGVLLFLAVSAFTVAAQVAAPNSPADQFAQAQQELQRDKVADALVILEKLASVEPPIKGLHHELGVAYYRTGKLLSAKQAFEAAVKEDPADLRSEEHTS